MKPFSKQALVFLRVFSLSLSKTLWEKEKLLVTRNSSFSYCVLYPFVDISAIFIKFKTSSAISLSSEESNHRLGGSVVSVSDSWPGGCEFDPRLGRLFFPAYFRLSPLQKHVRKVFGGFGKKSCVSTGVRKPANTYASPTTMIWL